MKKIIIAVVCGILIVGGVIAWFLLDSSDSVETVFPQFGNLENTVEETGMVVFDDEYTVTAMVSAEVLSDEFEEGDNVAEGNVLYVLDNGEMKNQIEQTENLLKQAKEAHSQSIEAANDLILYAKAGGLITKVYVHNGDFVQPGTPVAELVERDYLKLTIPFSLPEGISVYEGKAVKVIMSVNGSEVQGTVNKVYESEQSFDGGRRGKNVEIKLRNPGALKAGDTAFAEIDGISSISSANIENYTEQTIVASQSGEIEVLNIREGQRVNVGTQVMKVKNDTVSNAVTNTALRVTEIETTLSQLREKLDDFVIKSPTDGVVIRKNAKKSDIIQGGAPLAVVADVTRLFVEAEIDEIYINDVSVGQKAVVTLQNGEKTQYTGKVRRINDSGIVKNGVTYYQVQVELESLDGLVEGMNVDVSIVTRCCENVMYLPKECVNGGNVTVIRDGKQTEVSVRTGMKNEKYIEIVEGINKDDEVVVKGSEQ